jgi:glycosyltransferase involved in cell wall biosynthesis
MESFLNRWPYKFELVLILDPSQDRSKEDLEKLSSQRIEIVKIVNPRAFGRAKSLQKGLEQASGDWLIPFTLDHSVPMGELFSFLQEFHQPTPPDFVLGNRNTSRKKREAPKNTSWYWTLEKILLEKWRLKDQSIVDPLCGYWALRREAYEEIKGQFSLRRWHYTLDILPFLIERKKKIHQVPLLSKDPRSSQIPLVKEYLKNFF